jgi:hypothetical protein
MKSGNLQEEFAGVVARAVIELRRDIESLPLAHLHCVRCKCRGLRAGADERGDEKSNKEKMN